MYFDGKNISCLPLPCFSYEKIILYISIYTGADSYYNCSICTMFYLYKNCIATWRKAGSRPERWHFVLGCRTNDHCWPHWLPLVEKKRPGIKGFLKSSICFYQADFFMHQTQQQDIAPLCIFCDKQTG